MKAAAWHGLLVLDKPGGITSRDAVDRAQRWFPRGTRIGHTGTLDPRATGVLAVLHLVVMPQWRYRVHRWESTDQAVYTQTGWFTQERRIAPISRIQTVDSEFGVLERDSVGGDVAMHEVPPNVAAGAEYGCEVV